MVTNMKNETLNQLFNLSTLNTSNLIEQFSTQKLIDLAIESQDEQIKQETRKELINRGKESIQNRIEIKKICKASISSLEVILDDCEVEKIHSKDTVKSYKNKFLSLISLVDKVQLEWQRHDLGLMYEKAK